MEMRKCQGRRVWCLVWLAHPTIPLFDVFRKSAISEVFMVCLVFLQASQARGFLVQLWTGSPVLSYWAWANPCSYGSPKLCTIRLVVRAPPAEPDFRPQLYHCISFLLLLSGLKQHKFLSCTSGGQKSKMDLTGITPGVIRALFCLENPFSCLFQLLEATASPWLMTPLFHLRSQQELGESSLKGITLTLTLLPPSFIYEILCRLHWDHADNLGESLQSQGQLISNLNSICKLNLPVPGGIVTGSKD